MASLIDFSKPIYGTPTTQSVRDNFHTTATEITDLQDTRTPDWPYVPIRGAIMTGKLTLDADPVSNLHAATKQYVDNFAAAASGTIPEAPKDGWFYARGGAATPAGPNTWLSTPIFNALRIGRATTLTDFSVGVNPSNNLYGLSSDFSDALSYNRTTKLLSFLFGGTSIVDFNATSIAFKQPVTVAANPTIALGVATKQYVDTAVTAGAATIVVSDTAPVAPTSNALWWDSIGTQLYLWYSDANSSQWVNATNAGFGALNSDAPTDGLLYGRKSGAWATVPQSNVGRNLLHNPLFNIQQRGVGGFTTSGAYTADRWQQWFTSGTLTTSVNPASDAFRTQVNDEAFTYLLYSTFAGTAGAGDIAIVQQNTEGVRRLGGKTVTVSFWAAGAGLKLGVSIDQNFGTGGSPSAGVNGTGQSVSLSATFTRYSLTFTIPSTAGKTLGTAGNDITQMTFWLSAGSNYASRSGTVGVQSGSIALWGVQLEIGTTVTPLEKPDQQQDLAKCQRFYQTGWLYTNAYSGAAGAGAAMTSLLPVTMRATPTTTVQDAGANGLTGITATATNGGAIRLSGTTSAVGSYSFNTIFTASADL